MKTNDNMQLFERRLIEAVTWCIPKVSVANPVDCLRLLESARVEFRQLSGRDETATHQAIIESLVEEREKRLRASGHSPEVLRVNLYSGRLIACDPYGSLECGGAEQDSQGYLNIYDIPPCDTWVYYVQNQKKPADGFRSYFICWVPKEFIDFVEDGMACACGWGLEWVKDLDTPFARQLQQTEWFS